MMSHTELLQWTAEDRLNILKIYDRTSETVQDDIRIIRDWLKQQKHLPNNLSDPVIERFLCINKFRFEKVKACADMFYSIRNVIPQLYLKDNVKNPDIQKTWNVYYSFPLPLLYGNQRITIFKLKDFDASKYDGMLSVIREMYVGSVRLREDYDEAQITIVDLEGYSLSHALKITPSVLKITAFILENLYSNNLRGFHFLNAPNVADYLLKVFKLYVAPKILKRVHIHKTLDSLHEYVPASYLPIDLGGDKWTLDELNDKWKAKLDSYHDTLTELDNTKPDESLRPAKHTNNGNGLFGFEGNFRRLNVD